MAWYPQGVAQDAAITISAEATNAITASIQLKDNGGANLEEIGHVDAYLSDAATGIAISATAPATSVAAGTNGKIIKEQTTKLAWWLQSSAAGVIDLVITETGAKTWYLVVVLPNGRQIVSGAITFA